jgi:two-component system response regulator RpfG
MQHPEHPTGRVLIIDDQTTGRVMLEQAVRSIDRNLEVQVAASALEALNLAARFPTDLVLVDYRMPDIDGIEFIRRLRTVPGYGHVPIVMVTIFDSKQIRYRALDAGVTDFLTKPVDMRECVARCRNLLMLRRQQLLLEDRGRSLEVRVEAATREVRERERETLLRLAKAGEFRDENTGNHILRMARYSCLIGEAIGMEADELETLELAAPLHDLGKIGLPDFILLKSGRLTPEETLVMQRHPIMGYEILKDSASKFVRMGALIALGHHEKFDGSGYPYGHAGERIPLAARVVAVADVFDALTTRRPYKPAWDVESSFRYLEQHSGTHFDPAMVSGFMQRREAVEGILAEMAHEAA